MPNTSAAKRELRVAEKRHARNKSHKSMTKSKITGAEKLISSGDLEAAKQAVNVAASSLDKAIGKGVLHRNSAARRKARLVRKLNKAAAQPKAQASEAEPPKA
ncbi:MAG: 30S ribosomal protein S20 [Dehalococcoidia bacterium]|nr:30S ribosomal protein S20 [Dehalococcoidia bacterium]